METSGLRGSVAAWENGSVVLTRDLSDQQRSAQSLIPAVAALLNELGRAPADIDQIAVTVGPGSFTGLRVGVTAAKTLAYALKAKVVGVDTLDVLASQAFAGGQFSARGTLHAVLDAFRGQLFCRAYPYEDSAKPIWSTAPAAIVSIDEWIAQLAPGDCVVGPVLGKLAGQLPPGVEQVEASRSQPRAPAVANLGAAALARGIEDDLWRLVPRYVRAAAAEERAAQS